MTRTEEQVVDNISTSKLRQPGELSCAGGEAVVNLQRIMQNTTQYVTQMNNDA